MSVEHALSCPFGGFPSIRHNELRDIISPSTTIAVINKLDTKQYNTYRLANTMEQKNKRTWLH